MMKSAPSASKGKRQPKEPGASENTKRTLADVVRIQLTDEIVTRAHPPGTRLDEASIAKRFKVSRTPVREAMRQLATSGLITWRPHQGAIVASIEVHEMVELFEIMAEFEGLAGRLAARRMSDEERQELAELHKSFKPYVLDNDRETYQRMNRPFHIAIYQGAHNSYLEEHATALYDRLAPYRLYEHNRPGEIQNAYAEHDGIVNAILARQGDLAYKLLKEHTMLDADLLGDLMAAVHR